MFVIEDGAWQSGSTIDVYFYADNDGVPGSLRGYLRELEFSKVAGASYFGRRGFIYTIQLGGLHVPPGRYWLGARNPEASGSGTNYWMSSDAGRDGGGTSAGYFSLDGGATWAPEYTARPKAFQVYGEVLAEPVTFLLLGGLSLGALARRRSKGRSAGTR